LSPRIFLGGNSYMNVTGPWEVIEPTFRRAALPCEPCEVPMPVTCFGGHETSLLPCCRCSVTSCGRQCGSQLACGNHVCTYVCHPPEVSRVPMLKTTLTQRILPFDLSRALGGLRTTIFYCSIVSR